MSDVDDELLALVGNGSSSSRAGSPAASSRRRRKRRRDAESDDDADDIDDSGGSDVDAEGSDEDDDEGADEPVNPFRLEGIYKDEEDRERLLDMPELEREAELASRRDLIVQRRQKADLRAMVRTQQMAGRKTQQRSSRPATKKKTRRLKKPSAAPSRRRRKADSDEEEVSDDDEEDDESDEEEEEEESDYETSRRGGRARKAATKTSSKAQQLQKLKKSRAKAQRRRQGGEESDGESSGGDSESSYDAEEAEAVWRRKKERERIARGEPKREVKQTREEERRRKGHKWTLPSLTDVNAARVKRDHFTRLVHRPDWMAHLRNKFARINFTQKDRATGRVQTSYRLVQIVDCHEGDSYYEVADQYTNATCDMAWGGEKMKNVPLQFVSNSSVTEQEYSEWRTLVNQMDDRKVQRSVPSHEATQDQADELESFISRPFTEQDINQMLAQKKLARDAFQNDQRQKQQQKRTALSSGALGNGTAAKANQLAYDEKMLGEMNVKHRKADRERIVEAERRNAIAAKLAAQRLTSKTNTPAAETPPHTKAAGTPLGGSVPASPALKAVGSQGVNDGGVNVQPASIAIAAADVEIDLGDF